MSINIISAIAYDLRNFSFNLYLRFYFDMKMHINIVAIYTLTNIYWVSFFRSFIIKKILLKNYLTNIIFARFLFTVIMICY